MFPFIGLLEKLAIKSIHDGDKNDNSDFMMDDQLLAMPSIAIDQCHKTACDMAMITKDSLVKSLEMVKKYNEKKL